jgi:hypothetical protein
MLVPGWVVSFPNISRIAKFPAVPPGQIQTKLTPTFAGSNGLPLPRTHSIGVINLLNSIGATNLPELTLLDTIPMDFPETPADGIVGEAIVKLDIVEPTERHTATVIFLHVCPPCVKFMDAPESYIGIRRSRRHIHQLCKTPQ